MKPSAVESTPYMSFYIKLFARLDITGHFVSGERIMPYCHTFCICTYLTQKDLFFFITVCRM